MIHVGSPFARHLENARFSSPARGRYHGKWEAFHYWVCYFHQVNEILRLAKPDSRVLEVGPGNGVTTHVLRRLGLHVTTADADPTSSADHICDVRMLPFEQSSFDIVCCFEVLEHVPFADFRTILTRIRGMTRRHCIISLPEPGIEIGVAVKLPRLLPRSLWPVRKDYVPFSLKVVVPRSMQARPEPKHQWEVGRRGFSRQTVEREIRLAGLRIARRFSAPLSMRFLFYVLERDP